MLSNDPTLEELERAPVTVLDEWVRERRRIQAYDAATVRYRMAGRRFVWALWVLAILPPIGFAVTLPHAELGTALVLAIWAAAIVFGVQSDAAQAIVEGERLSIGAEAFVSVLILVFAFGWMALAGTELRWIADTAMLWVGSR
jgi:hypothetical protein